ncbi:hypothetical protein LIER_36826 [Lithospermum erythrorhizon]|uniref:Uncharacterized protein n=1 Tax=Lithospermum erythrorhizon TaxID=34254 RepID=A0AAV3PBX4_LITER
MADGEPPDPPPLLEDGKALSIPIAKPILTFSKIIQGKPAVVFKNAEKKLLLDSLPFVLVGKFSHDVPVFLQLKYSLPSSSSKVNTISHFMITSTCSLIVRFKSILLRYG